MVALGFFLVCLIIAPQLWLPPFVGLPTDFIGFPLLMLAVLLSGRLIDLFRLTVHDLLLLAFVIWMLLSIIANGFTPESSQHTVFYAKVFVLFKLVSTLLWDLQRRRKFVRIFIALTLILGIEVLWHRFSPDGRGWAGQAFSWIDPSVLEAGGKGRARWVGIFDGPGVFCVLFTISLPFLLPMIGRNKAFAVRIFGAAAIALALVATYFIGSRGGLLATLAIIALHVMIRSKISMRAILACGALSVAVFTFAPDYLTTVRDQSNSSQYRVEMWAQGLEMIKMDPLLGVGRGNFRAYTSKLIAHNSAMEIGAETGLVGLFLWSMLIYFCIKAAWRRYLTETDAREREFCLASALAVVGYVISAMFVTLEYETFYLLLALCASMSRYAPAPVPVVRSDYVIVGTTIVSFLVGMQLFVIMYFA